ncbi:MAG: hypothetical protein KA105_09600 [Caulobacter sp.]|jgi:hypothetical protein|nr:hypothetical protein [Caulobacter sp.]
MAQDTNFDNAAAMEQLKARALAAHRDKIKRIKLFAQMQPDHPFTAANRGVLELDDDDSTWNGAGVLTMTGVVWWALNLTVDLAFPNVIMFNATGGPDWDVALFTSDVAGYFLVDPSTLGGEASFQMQAVGVGVGEVSFDLYTTSGTQLASFAGAVAGVSASKLAGNGTLTYNP